MERDTLRAELEGALPGYLRGLRWFGGQTRELVAVSIDRWLDLRTEADASLMVVTVQDAAGHTTEHQLYLGRDRGRRIVDALEIGEVRSALLELALAGGHRDGHELVLRGDPLEGGAMVDRRGDGELLGAEQSNTSVLFGKSCILKVYRRLEHGPNPDVELLRFLTGEAHSPAVPPMLATARLEGPSRFSCDAITVQAYVENRGDGWAWALQQAREEVARGRPAESTLQGAEAIGRVTASLHAALARAEAPGLKPVPAQEEDVTAWMEATRIEAARTLAVIERAAKKVDPRAIQRVAAASRLEVAEPGLKMRIHGDYHLGQLLHGPDGFVVLDFEGEPSRPLAERRALQHPLVDVAGMVRSWGYAAETAGRETGSSRESIDGWLVPLRLRFLEAYWRGAADGPEEFVPRDAASRDTLLSLFELRKALFEVQYELNNRPDWVAIPLAGLPALVERALP